MPRRDSKIGIYLEGKDKASASIKKVDKQLDKAGKTAKTTGSKFSGLADRVKGLVSGFGILSGAAGIAGVTYAFVKLGKAMIAANAEFERYETQFKVLHGSVGAAQERLENLINFAKTTPFELPEVIKASKVLKVFGQDTDEMLTIIGDAAAGSGANFEELAMWMGRISAGDTGRGLMRLTELGITSRKELAAMGIEFGKAGDLISSTDKLMESLTRTMETRFGGQMVELSATFEGMYSNMQDSWWNIKRIIGEPIFDKAKEGLSTILDYLEELEESGTFEVWAQDIGGVADAISTLLIPVLWTVKGAINSIVTDISKLKAVGEEEMKWAISNKNIFEDLVDTTDELSESTFDLNSYFDVMIGELDGLDLSAKAYLETMSALSDAHEAMARVLSKGKKEKADITPDYEPSKAATDEYYKYVIDTAQANLELRNALFEASNQVYMDRMLEMTEELGVVSDQQLADLIASNDAKLEAQRDYFEEWKGRNREAYAVITDLNQQMWQLMIRSDMTGSQKIKALWENLKSTVVGIIGEMIKEQIIKALVLQGVNKVATSTELGLASAKIFQAHAFIPFVGVSIATAQIAQMYATMAGLGSFQSGTSYVPKTGMYMLHQGEAVVPRTENYYGGGTEINFNVNVTEETMLPMVEAWSEEVLLPMIQKLISERKL